MRRAFSCAESFGFLHQLATFSHYALRLLRQGVPSPLLPFPAQALSAVVDALIVLSGRAVSAVPLVDDGAHGAEPQRHFLRNPPQRLASLVQLEHLSALRLTGTERAPYRLQVAVDDGQKPVPLTHKFVVSADEIAVFLPE